MEEWVNRPMEVRRQEVEKRNGYVTRPMNSFMLYRSAYAERTKLWCLQNNHQVVSSVSGVSWPLEPSSIRERYNDLAKIERVNHQNAHPGYKFSPSKAQTTKRKASDEEESEPSDLDDPDEDYGKSLETRAKRKRKGKQSKKSGKEAGYPANSTFRLDRHVGNGLNKSSYQATNPGKPLPAAMDTTSLYGHYYQSTVRQSASAPNVEDVTLRKTEAPGMHYTGTPPLIGLPGGHEYDLMRMSFVNSSAPLDTMKVDPSLLEYDSQHGLLATEDHFSEEGMASLNSSFLSHMPDSQFASPYAVENLPSEDLQDYLSSQSRIDHHQIPGYQPEHKLLDLGLFHVNDNQHEHWHMNEDTEELDPGSEYDKWMDDKTRE
jgi:HMG (high mobility group) box